VLKTNNFVKGTKMWT